MKTKNKYVQIQIPHELLMRLNKLKKYYWQTHAEIIEELIERRRGKAKVVFDEGYVRRELIKGRSLREISQEIGIDKATIRTRMYGDKEICRKNLKSLRGR
ncbi:hypothetical protein K8R33_00510 [archaeon]|nr:hypothetical protein [archaeon]